MPTFEDEYLREVIDNVVMAEDFFPIAAKVLRPAVSSPGIQTRSTR